jgi:hypothetical protein
MWRAMRSLCALLVMAGSASGAPLSDSEARVVLDALAGGDADAATAAIERVIEADDERFAAPLIEVLRAGEVGIASPRIAGPAAASLGRLTGERHGSDWSAWVRWYAGTQLAAPPGFADWKGALWARVDPRFARLLRDDWPSRIRVEEIVWGGVAYEGIPSLDRPRTIAAEEATWLEPDEPVIGVAWNGEARAYPNRILDWHEMANDVVGGEAIALAYCTLCGSAIAYRTRSPEGLLSFGSSGLLFRSNKLMVDRGTRTLWNQLTGEPVLGPLAKAGARLDALPSVVARWKDWRAAHPATRVVALETGFQRSYEPGAAYGSYFASRDMMFPVRITRDEVPPKTRVYGLRAGGTSKAYPIAALAREGVLNDRVGERDVVLVATRGTIGVRGRSARDGAEAKWDAGAEVRAYARGARHFTRAPDPKQVVDEAGQSWTIEEGALVGPDGARVARLVGVSTYWFAWQSFAAETEIWEKRADPQK